jgi:hypothetical protein
LIVDDATYTTELRYLRELADLLGLRDWHITLSRGIAAEGSRAQVDIHRTKDECEVRLSNQWRSFSLEQRRLTITHELLHAHTSRLHRVMTRLADVADGPSMEYAKRAHDEEEEIVVQRLARVIAPYLPLPEQETS